MAQQWCWHNAAYSGSTCLHCSQEAQVPACMSDMETTSPQQPQMCVAANAGLPVGPATHTATITPDRSAQQQLCSTPPQPYHDEGQEKVLPPPDLRAHNEAQQHDHQVAGHLRACARAWDAWLSDDRVADRGVWVWVVWVGDYTGWQVGERLAMMCYMCWPQQCTRTAQLSHLCASSIPCVKNATDATKLKRGGPQSLHVHAHAQSSQPSPPPNYPITRPNTLSHPHGTLPPAPPGPGCRW